MIRKTYILVFILICFQNLYAQVSIGTKTPDPSAMLDVSSSNKGMLVPRMTSIERKAIQKPASGLLVYQTDGNSGFYYYAGNEWKFLLPASTTANGVAVNATTPTTVTSVSGTTNRITSTGGAVPVIDIAPTYVGQSSITTLGTIATGTWNATVIPATKGGAGTVNGLMKANGTGTVSAAVAGTDYLKPNTAIVAATKTKLTYNAQGLVTAGADATTTDIKEGTNQYFTPARSRSALSLTTTGSSGAATYNATTGVLNIPIYTGGTGGTSYTFSSPLSLSGTSVSIPAASTTANGYLSSIDWNTFNNKLSSTSAAAIYAPINSPTFTGTVNGITKSMVGLSNVDNTSDLNKPVSTATQTALDTKVTANTAITSGTKTKISYDSKGLVTSGADATTTDIAEGSNLYFTEDRVRTSSLTGLTSGTNTSIQASDKVLEAFAKVQSQLDDKSKKVDGANLGDMLYWNGTSWVKLPIGKEQQSLIICNGVPTWGGCLAEVSTPSIFRFTSYDAVIGGSVTNTGGSNIKEKGLVWSTSPNPDISLTTKLSMGSGIADGGVFGPGTISGLDKNTTYYIRAYAINSAGVSYGNEISFTTLDVDITSGLVAYYPMNGDANDYSGNSYNGNPSNLSYTSDRRGLNQNAALFNGSTSVISTPFTGISDANSRTISFWAKTIDNNLTMMDVVSWGANSNGQSFEVALNSGCNSLTVDLYNGIRSNTYENTSDNNWHYYCVVYDKNQGSTLYTGFRFYVDGILLTTSLCGSNSYPQDQFVNTVLTNPMLIGRYHGFGTRFFNGSLDEIRIYNRTLTQEEIIYLSKH